MAFELPNLDSSDSAALQAELIRRIPLFTTRWTDFNASDPGITLLQMLCWIGESLLYQANGIPLQTHQNFLREVLGLASSSDVTDYGTAAQANHDAAFLQLQDVLAQMEAGLPLTAADLQHAVLDYRATPYLAVTLEDVQALALQSNRMIVAEQAEAHQTTPPTLVKRADALVRDQAIDLCVLATSAWDYQLPPWPNTADPVPGGRCRRVLLLAPPVGDAAMRVAASQQALLTSVATYMAPRVLLGNRVGVLQAQLTPINLAVEVRCLPNMNPVVVLDAMLSALSAYFQPEGWRYNQAPHFDDIQVLIENIPGVAGLVDLRLDYAPTVQLDGAGQVGANLLLADLPPGNPRNVYRGLPQLRCLDLTVGNTP